jgi:hypothetical protein
LAFRPEASADIAEAFSWYEERRAVLGAEFESELDRTLGYITGLPLAGRAVHRTLRRPDAAVPLHGLLQRDRRAH